MLFNNNLDQIRIEESQLVIKENFICKKNIPINEIKKVYVSVKKIPTIYEIVYILFGGIFIGLNFSFYPVGFYFWLVSGIYLLGEFIVHNYKSCTLNLELQNEKVQIRYIPYELKYQLVHKINKIKFRIR
jgi:hypothetical protein